ncbi:type I 3-dehydroquinate dehydratase [Boudabousia marimammalium]|uniref:3-dehydroquinate dehydratase n=1 Tax=Boudabousia marimammalium TaxID=156892 RepID=A0A1Q5PSV5_9ACTO|nr:type I 3-dehydroquinate dehydratase [Boudabousia marimammalium]OKL50646.1 hypothetical protein BM477_01480 [Boudabousia marimammalium]
MPIQAATKTGLLEQANQARGIADVVEVRLDALGNLPEIIKNSDWGFLNEVRAITATPILATIRTTEQGGKAQLAFMDYAEGVAEVARTAEYVDVEWDLEIPEPILGGLIDAVRQGGAQSVVSRHDYENMPTVAELDAYFSGAKRLGAHVAKLAVTPANRTQVAQLMQVISRHAEQNQREAKIVGRVHTTPNTEILGIGMGEVGAISRLSGHLYGNCATFAALPGNSTAPGQPDARRLVETLDQMASVIPPR